MTTLVLPSGYGKAFEISLRQFAHSLEEIDKDVGFKMSARGWCYLLEGLKTATGDPVITKAQFDLVENYINKCRERGYIPIDFTAEEEGRKFSGIEEPTRLNSGDFIEYYIKALSNCERYYIPDWWIGERYYIQMLVEKIDLKTLFEPVCRDYHIPIATSKGWSSMLQRAEYARRFSNARNRGLIPVLLYCGDHDPDGLRISKSLRDNLLQLKDIVWEDGTEGFDPGEDKDSICYNENGAECAPLIIERFGLNYDFILRHNLTWIDNLITGSKKNLADTHHKNHHMQYVQEYLAKVGTRKCEANAIVKEPALGRVLCRMAIERFLNDGTTEDTDDAIDRFKKRRDRVDRCIRETRARVGITKDRLDLALTEALQNIDRDDDPNYYETEESD